MTEKALVTTPQKMAFGYYPAPLSVSAGAIKIDTLPNFKEIITDISASESVHKSWIYAPPQKTQNFGGRVEQLPYASRVFGLPKTHSFEHTKAESRDHITFHIWALSFFTGMRLTAYEAGFIDSTPIRKGELVDFRLHRGGFERAIEVAEKFWIDNRAQPDRAKVFAAAVHALFFGQNPQHLQFENFIYLYTALDACFKLASCLRTKQIRCSHAERIEWMCKQFEMATPSWAEHSTISKPEVPTIRNAALHEALFMGEPLGFAFHGKGTNQNLTLEMQALICRLLVALLGESQADYVRTPINTRSIHGLDLS